MTSYQRRPELGTPGVDEAIHLLGGELVDEMAQSLRSLFAGSDQSSFVRIGNTAKSGQRSRSYVEDLSVMILCGLGVEPKAARQAARERATFIRGMAPERLSWWRDPWQ